MLSKISGEEIVKGFINDYPKVKDDFKKVLYDDGYMWNKGWKRQNAFGMEGGWLNPSTKLSIRIRWGIRNPSAIIYVEKEFADIITQFFDHHEIVAGIATANSDYDLLNERKVIEEIK